MTLPGTAFPLPPLLPGAPLVGSALELTRDRLAFTRRMARLGSVGRFRMFNLELYHVSEPEAIQRVLQDNARHYVKGPLFDPMRSLVGNGLFLSNGDFWRPWWRVWRSRPRFRWSAGPRPPRLEGCSTWPRKRPPWRCAWSPGPCSA